MPADPILRDRARRLRRERTDAERTLWQRLRGKQLGGLKFRRQHVVGPWILDFYCPECRLAVELDGGQHNETENRRRDEARTAFLEDRGMAVRAIRTWRRSGRPTPCHRPPCSRKTKAGIALRIDPGRPQQNGRHERMHKTLKAETTRPPAANKEEQQVRFDRFREDFNANRPHEAPHLRPSNGWRSPGMMPGTPCAGCAPTARSSGAEIWCSSARRWQASRSALPRPTAGTGSCASPTSTLASSTAGRKNFTASARPGRRAEAERTQKTVTHLFGL